MKALILFVTWCVLLVLCWPVAVLALILFPIVWLISLPLRLIGVTVSALFAFLSALLFLPARIWDGKGADLDFGSNSANEKRRRDAAATAGEDACPTRLCPMCLHVVAEQ